MPAGAANEGMQKITLTLPDETVKKLDAIAKNSLLASRGRVIQSLVDEVLEVRLSLAKVEQDMKSMNFKDSSNAWGAVLNMSITVNDISRRLSKFDDRVEK